jgi:hypothetical protein
VLTAGQAIRRNRLWWRTILDQFGAADVITPIARLQREYPGGPVTGRFAARYGPDNKFIGSFILKVKSSADIPAMFDQAIKRFDEIYTQALSSGKLKTEKSLIIEDPFDLSALEQELEAELAAELGSNSGSSSSEGSGTSSTGATSTASAQATASGQAINVTVQFNTPDVGAVGRGESSVRSVPGVKSASTSSLALGGVSVMRVSYGGDIATLAAGLRSRGWQVQQGAGALRITRGGGSTRPTPPPAGEAEGNEPEQ